MTTKNDRAKAIMREVVDGLLAENEDAKAAYDAILKRGFMPSVARDEIERALLGCHWEVSKGMPDRMAEVWTGLKKGRSASELFPDEFYED